MINLGFRLSKTMAIILFLLQEHVESVGAATGVTNVTNLRGPCWIAMQPGSSNARHQLATSHVGTASRGLDGPALSGGAAVNFCHQPSVVMPVQLPPQPANNPHRSVCSNSGPPQAVSSTSWSSATRFAPISPFPVPPQGQAAQAHQVPAIHTRSFHGHAAILGQQMRGDATCEIPPRPAESRYVIDVPVEVVRKEARGIVLQFLRTWSDIAIVHIHTLNFTSCGP